MPLALTIQRVCRRRPIMLVVLWLMISALSRPAFSQEPATHAAPQWELGPYVGVARQSPVTNLGRTPDRSHVFLGVHIAGTFLQWRRLSLAYAPEVVPLLLVTQTPTYTTTTERQGLQQVEVKHVTGTGVAAGFALSPIGMESQVAIGREWRGYANVAAGAVWFGRDVPEPYTRAVNYTFEFGGGLQSRVSARWSLRAGYKFHHLSNAGSGEINPGLNGHVVTVGLTRRLGARP